VERSRKNGTPHSVLLEGTINLSSSLCGNVSLYSHITFKSSFCNNKNITSKLYYALISFSTAVGVPELPELKGGRLSHNGYCVLNSLPFVIFIFDGAPKQMDFATRVH